MFTFSNSTGRFKKRGPDPLAKYIWSAGVGNDIILVEGDRPYYDFAWLDDDGTYREYEKTVKTTDEADSPVPCFVNMSSNPQNVGGVNKSGFSDNYSDTLDTCKWNINQGADSILSTQVGLLNFVNTGTASSSYTSTRLPIDTLSGVFSMEVNLKSFSTSGLGSPSGHEVCTFGMRCGANEYYAGVRYLSGGSQQLIYRTPAFGQQFLGSIPLGIIKITRDVSNNVKVFFDGVQVGTTNVDSGPVTNQPYITFTASNRPLTITMDDFIIS
jgi:hypothetical protein